MTEPHVSLNGAGAGASPPIAVADLFRRSRPLLDGRGGAPPTRWLAWAPASFDVMGGIAEYTGADILRASFAHGAAVTVQLRDDDRITIQRTEPPERTHQPPITLPRNGLADWSRREWSDAATDDPCLRAALGAVYALVNTGKLNNATHGASIVVDGQSPFLVDASMTASVAVASLLALIRAWDLRFDPAECAQLAQLAENDVVGFPCGPGGALGALHCRHGSLLQCSCQSKTPIACWTVPKGVALLGIDCGHRCPDADRKYAKARTAAFMGRLLVDRILQAKGGNGVPWNGMLGQLKKKEYVQHVRDHIPTKIKGADFIQCFGQTADPLTRVEPNAVYRLRSRTEHHVYESERAREFAALFARAAEGDRIAVTKAGEIMYGSHWTYGQRCGLGSVETDRIVTLLRRRGADAGIYGARISGHGSGGIVVVLMDAGPDARQALHAAIREYEEITHRSATVFEGTACGAIEFGVHSQEA